MAKIAKRAEDTVPRNPRAQLDEGAREIRELSEGLDARIKSMESWLSELTGRVATKVTLTNPDGEGFDLVLWFERGGGSGWSIYFRWQETTTGKPQGKGEWKSLISANLDTKMLSVGGFPLLYDKMADAQAGLLARLRAANQQFDDFANQVGVGKKEGA